MIAARPHTFGRGVTARKPLTMTARTGRGVIPRCLSVLSASTYRASAHTSCPATCKANAAKVTGWCACSCGGAFSSVRRRGNADTQPILGSGGKSVRTVTHQVALGGDPALPAGVVAPGPHGNLHGTRHVAADTTRAVVETSLKLPGVFGRSALLCGGG